MERSSVGIYSTIVYSIVLLSLKFVILYDVLQHLEIELLYMKLLILLFLRSSVDDCKESVCDFCLK